MGRGRWTLVAAGLAVSCALYAAPAGAAGQAEADPNGLARFQRQQLDWHACQQGPGDEEGQALDQAGARCAEVTVPLDYGRPAGRTIELAISRLEAGDTARRIGPMIINLGGPAIPVLARVVDARLAMGETGARFDLIGMDPRFAGRSTPLDCGWPSSWVPRSAGATRRSFDRMTGLSRDLARRCAERYGEELAHASTADVARDMDVVRAALGEARLSYLGYSYGSYFGAVYAQMFPHRAGRMVLDSAIDPADPGTHMCADQAVPRDPQWYWRDLQARRARHPLFGPLDRRLPPCAFWPTGPKPPVQVHNGVPALIVNADGDINATPELNRAMHRALTGSRMVTLAGVRTHGVYLFQGAPCVDDAVNAYLNSGALPAQDFTCARPG